MVRGRLHAVGDDRASEPRLLSLARCEATLRASGYGREHSSRGGQANIRYTVLDSTHQLVGGKLPRPKMSYLRFMRGVELFLRAIFFFLPDDMIENVARPKRWKKRIQKIFNRK